MMFLFFFVILHSEELFLMISVCMATYNGQNYLKEQIDSILCQLGRDDELVISDDHSTDKTQEIIKAYTDSRIRFFENELAKGVTHNFENALNKSAGDIIFLSDQDDVWYPNKIKEMTAFLLEGQYEVVTCNCALTDSELHITQETYYTTESPLDRSVWGNFKKDLWLGSCMAFKRTILQDVLPIPKHLAAHDMWIALYSQLHFRCGYYPRVLQLYRRHNHTVSFAGQKSTNSLWYKLGYRAYWAWFLLWRSLKRKGAGS